jgi:hypothetical protein
VMNVQTKLGLMGHAGCVAGFVDFWVYSIGYGLCHGLLLSFCFQANTVLNSYRAIPY